jgi:hypothetical protein
MTNKFLTIALVLLSTASALAGSHDPNDIIPLLKGAKITLLEGIKLAEKLSGPATSAKFEAEDGNLMLSVYTIPEGLSVEPEKATLSEVSAVASSDPIELKTEVFTDKEHIAVASSHLTLLQLSKMSLRQVIADWNFHK